MMMTKPVTYPDPERVKYPVLPSDINLTEQEYFVIKEEFYDVNSPIKGSGLFGQWMGKVLLSEYLRKRLKERNVSVEGYKF